VSSAPASAHRRRDVDRPCLAREVGAPDVLEEPVAGEDDARIPCEGRQQVEFARPEREPSLADRRFPAARIDPQGPDLDRSCSGPPRLGPAEDRLHSRDERSRVERLRDIVVRAELEPDDRVDVVGASGQHEDRRVGRPPDLPADLVAVDLRQHEVEDDEVGVMATVEASALTAGAVMTAYPFSR
jgi:hypothetical protein